MKQRARGSAVGRGGVRVACLLGLLAGVAGAQEPPEDPVPEEPPADAPPPAPPPPLSDEQWAELDAYVASAQVAFDVPGAALALIQDGQVQRVGTYGVLGVDDATPVDEETLFMIGSLTKSMTTTLAATLVSDGYLDWDDAITDHLPGFAVSNPAWTPLVRVRDAFGHTSGVPRADLPLFIDFHRPLGLSASVANIPALAAPGERYDYQNQVFSVGGFALARAAGARNRSGDISRTYERLLQRRVLRPLQMRRTTLDFEAAIRDDNHASPHALDPASASAGAFDIGVERFALPVAPAGAVWASIDDMGRYLAMHLREGVSVEGVRVVSAAELAETHTAQTVAEGSTGYGLGWGVAQSPAGDVLVHQGGTAGFISQVVGFPSLDYGWVLLTNSLEGASLVSAVGRRVAELVFGLSPLGDADLLAAHAEREAALAAFLTLIAPVDAEAVAGHVGRYERRLSVSHEGDELVLRTVYAPLHFKALPELEATYVCTDPFFVGVPLQLGADEQGRATLSLGFGLDDSGAIVDPLVVSRIGDASPPRHPGHHVHAPRARHGRRVGWSQLPNALRPHRPEQLGFTGGGSVRGPR